MHFAIMNNNTKALRILVQNLEPSISLDIPNSDGKTPKDLAMMYKLEEDRVRFILILNRSFSHQSTINSP